MIRLTSGFDNRPVQPGDKVIFSGSREWDPVAYPEVTTPAQAKELFDFMVEEMVMFPRDVVIIEGEAPGADKFAREAGLIANLFVERYPAHWRHTPECHINCKQVVGRAAGPIRNGQMLREGKATYLYAFFRKSESSGTANMVKQARAAGILVKEFIYDTDGGTSDTE